MSKRIPEQEYLKKRYKRLGGWSYSNLLYYDKDKGRYIKDYRGRRSKAIKKQSNRKIRYYKGDLGSELGNYKKISEFWWELY